MRALLIRHPHIDKILARKKTWEIRGSRTSLRARVGLIASGSGTVIGVCDLVNCVGPLTAAEFRKNATKAGMRPSEATLGYYRQTFAWVVKNARTLERPVPSPARCHHLGEVGCDRREEGQDATAKGEVAMESTR